MSALLVVSIPFLNNRSLTAFSKDQLYQLVWWREEGSINWEIKNDAEHFRTYKEMLEHWKIIHEELMQWGADDQTASVITNAARGIVVRPNGTFPHAHWPVMACKGWILNKPIWIVIVNYPKNVPWPLKANQLNIPLTHPGQIWDGGILLFDSNGIPISP